LERVERRLAAILAADVAGYSRLIGVDEEGTLARLKAHRSELIDPKIAEHRGRIVKTTGDGMLVEFASVVDALRCATEVQAAMAVRNAEVPKEKLIEFRMGINLGDVILIAEDVITALSRYRSLFVIARNSCFAYKGRPVDVKQIGREFTGRYALEGSLRKAGNRIRAAAQLVKAETGKHVWAERCSGGSTCANHAAGFSCTSIAIA